MEAIHICKSKGVESSIVFPIQFSDVELNIHQIMFLVLLQSGAFPKFIESTTKKSIWRKYDGDKVAYKADINQLIDAGLISESVDSHERTRYAIVKDFSGCESVPYSDGIYRIITRLARSYSTHIKVVVG